MRIENSEGYENLAAAIVMRAYVDWCDDCRKLAAKKSVTDSSKKRLIEILKFVESDWYSQLTNIPAERMIHKMTEVKEQYASERIPGKSL